MRAPSCSIAEGFMFGMRCASGDARGRGFFSAYENILETVIVTDTKLTVIFVNAAVERVLGYKPSNLIGANAHALIPPSVMTHEEHRRMVAEYVRTNERGETHGSSTSPSFSLGGVVGTRGREIKVLASDGRVVPTLVSLERMNLSRDEAVAIIPDYENRNVQPYLFIACLQDLTATVERARSQQATLTQRSILNFVLHEIRNPLLGIDAASSLIHEEISLVLLHDAAAAHADEEKEPSCTVSVPLSVLTGLFNDVDNIRCGVGHMSRLVSNCLDAEKLATRGDLMPLRMDDVDIRECFGEVLRMVKLLAKTGVNVRATVAPDVPPLVLSDRQRLIQVLLNLMTNAMKYTDSGTVTLTARVGPRSSSPSFPPSLPHPSSSPSPTTTRTTSATAKHLVIRCEDSGPGVPLQHQADLFTNGFCTLPGSRAGTGLGLAVSKILVEKLGGDIEVESNESDEDLWPPPGTTGSAFIVKLPLFAARGDICWDDVPSTNVLTPIDFRPPFAHGASPASVLSSAATSPPCCTDHEMKSFGHPLGLSPCKSPHSATVGPTRCPFTSRIERMMGASVAIPPGLHLLSKSASVATNAAAVGAVSSPRLPPPSNPPSSLLPVGIRVLVVDDSPINRTLMRRMLQSRQIAPSWEVEDAENGEAALRLVSEHGADHYHLFIIDQHLDMTDGSLLGVDVIDRLRRMGAQGVKILCTGSNSVLSEHLGSTWDAVDLLWGKPLPSKEHMRRDLAGALAAVAAAAAAGGGGGGEREREREGRVDDNVADDVIEREAKKTKK